ncbi:MAG: FAD-binding oxidoreductase, partial [Saccharothrix sp.]|nr:FAD-binding oxidoreductase [Saccharothrix sp.]
MYSTKESAEDGLTAWAVGPQDQQYPELVRGTNQRYVGAPEQVRLVTRVEQVAPVVQEAVDAGKRLTVRSGGHCYEDFVFNPEVQVVLDLSRLSEVYFDP